MQQIIIVYYILVGGYRLLFPHRPTPTLTSPPLLYHCTCGTVEETTYSLNASVVVKDKIEEFLSE